MKSANYIIRKAQVLFLLFLSFLFSGTASAQGVSPLIDSLENKLKSEWDPEKRANLYADLAWEYLYVNPERTIQYSNESMHWLTKYPQSPDEKLINRASVISMMANAYYVKGEYEKSIGVGLEILGIADSLNDDKRRSVALILVGNAYSAMKNYDEAIKYYYKSLALKKKINDVKGEMNCNINIGGIHLYRNANDSARVYLEDALEIARQLKDKRSVIAIESNLGVLYKRMQLWDRAIAAYISTVEYRKNNGEIYKQVQGMLNLGILYNEIDSTESAYNVLFAAKQLLENTVFDDLKVEVLKSLARSEFELKKYSDCYQHMRQAFELADKLYAESSVKNIAEMQSKYELDKKQKEIELLSREKRIKRIESERQQQQISLLNAEKALKEAQLATNEAKIQSKQEQLEFLKKQNELETKEARAREAQLQAEAEKKEFDNKRQRVIIFSVIIGLFISLVSTFFIFRALQQNKKAKRIIEEQKKHVEEQKELLQEKNKEILDSINYAKRLQEAILPPLSLVQSVFPDSFVLYIPKDIVAGDFYFLEQEKNNIVVAAADCTGHGVPGALVSVVCSNALNRVVKEFGLTSPGNILNRTKDLVVETFRRSDKEVKDGMDISLCSISDAGSDVFNIEWAGANNPLWYISDGQMHEIVADKQPIGLSYESTPFTNNTIQLKKGDVLFLFTDGYADQFGGPKGKKFKYRTLQEFLFANRNLDMKSMHAALIEAFNKWKGELEQIDDVCMIGIRL